MWRKQVTEYHQEIRELFWPSFNISSVWILVLLPWTSPCLSFFFFLKIPVLEEFNAPFKRKRTLLALMDPEKTFEVWLESTSQHTLTGWKNRCQTKGTPCLLSTLLMFVPYPWLETKRLKTSKHILLFLENCWVMFSRFLSSCKDLKYLENGKKTKKCESWDLTKWTPNCKMCKEMSSGECCE